MKKENRILIVVFIVFTVISIFMVGKELFDRYNEYEINTTTNVASKEEGLSTIHNTTTEEFTTMIVESLTEMSTTEERKTTTTTTKKVVTTKKPSTTSTKTTTKKYSTEEVDLDSLPDDLRYLAIAIYCENGSASERTKLLTGNVILNRVAHENYPDTIYDVLMQKGQYGRFYYTGIVLPERYYKWDEEKAEFRNCIDIAKRLLDGERVCPENVLYQAEFEQGSGLYEYREGTYFCYY